MIVQAEHKSEHWMVVSWFGIIDSWIGGYQSAGNTTFRYLCYLPTSLSAYQSACLPVCLPTLHRSVRSKTNNPLGQSIHIRRDFLFAQFAERQIHSHHGYRAVFLCHFLHHTPFLRFPTESPCTQPFNASSTMLISSSSVTALHSIPFHSYNHRSPSPRSFLRSKNVETELSSRSGCESRSHTRCIRGTRQREMYGRDEDLWTRKKSTKEGKKNVHTADQQTNTVRTTFVCESTEMLF